QILKGRCWTVPVLAAKRFYCRNAAGHLVCLDASVPDASVPDASVPDGKDPVAPGDENSADDNKGTDNN
ncbi:MAG: hypothetical protein ACI9HK_005974, partial [Pirellulaceae bacterium]